MRPKQFSEGRRPVEVGGDETVDGEIELFPVGAFEHRLEAGLNGNPDLGKL
jgi:hypothetical protein